LQKQIAVKSERRQKPDMPFNLAFALGDFGKGGDPTFCEIGPLRRCQPISARG
jgi:hypothetical protein